MRRNNKYTGWLQYDRPNPGYRSGITCMVKPNSRVRYYSRWQFLWLPRPVPASARAGSGRLLAVAWRSRAFAGDCSPTFGSSDGRASSAQSWRQTETNDMWVLEEIYVAFLLWQWLVHCSSDRHVTSIAGRCAGALRKIGSGTRITSFS